MKKEYLIYKLSEEMKEATRIDTALFPKFDVKRGLRNEDGTGVLVGLTRIGNVVGYERIPGGGLKPIPGKLFYPSNSMIFIFVFCSSAILSLISSQNEASSSLSGRRPESNRYATSSKPKRFSLMIA